MPNKNVLKHIVAISLVHMGNKNSLSDLVLL